MAKPLLPRFPFLVAVVVVALVRALGLKFGTSVEESAEQSPRRD